MKAPLALHSGYLETRRPASEQRLLNLYPHTKGGFRQYPGYSQFASISTSAALTHANNLSSDLGSEVPHHVWVRQDGKKMYVIGMDSGTSLTIHQFSLTRDFDTSSFSYDSKTFSLTGLTGWTNSDSPGGLVLSPDGTKAVVVRVHSSQRYMYELTLSSAWDISTASEAYRLDYESDEDSAIYDIAWSRLDPGNTLYCVGGSTSRNVIKFVFATGTEYTLNRSITTTKSSSLYVANSIEFLSGFDINDDETEITVSDNGGASSGDVFTIPLSTAGDVSTITLGSRTALGLSSDLTTYTQVRGLQRRNGDNRFYMGSLSGTPRQLEFALGGAGRGMIHMGSSLFVVVGPTLYEIDSIGGTTSRGTIADQPAAVVMETDGTQLVITTGTTIYRYQGGTLTTVTDADINDTAKSSAYLDLRFWLDQPNGQFNSSDVDDATSYDALNFATAESFADDMLRVYAHNQKLYLFGETSTEVWRTGSGRPPADRQAVIERGIIGTHAVTAIDDQIYFVDQFSRPNVMMGFQYQPIYTPAVAEEWGGYEVTYDCVCSAYTYKQQNFVHFAFPTEGKSWTYHVGSGEWSERDSSGSMYSVSRYSSSFNKLLGLDDSGKLWELSETDYQDDTTSITRAIHTATVGPELVGGDSRRISVNGLWLTIEATGSGSVSVSFARDGGAFGTAKSITVSEGVKNYPLPTPWGVCSEGVFQLSTSSNVGIDFIDGLVDVSPIHV